MLTQSLVKEKFDYADGNLIRRKKTKTGYEKGSMAGSAVGTKGYLNVHIDRKRQLVHRLIWLWHYGFLPENILDHIDQNKKNNRIENLREVSNKCNIRNSKISKANTSGVKGVSFDNSRGLWTASMSADCKTKHLGRFDCFTEAVAHRFAAEQCVEWSKCETISTAKKHIRIWCQRDVLLKQRGFDK